MIMEDIKFISKVEIHVKLLRNIVAWLIEKDDMKFSYSKQFLNALNENKGKEGNVEVSLLGICKLCEYVEYLSVYDKRERYGYFYYKLKRLLNN